MHYNGPIVRPPTHADSVFIETTVVVRTISAPFVTFTKAIHFALHH
nr:MULTISPECIES: hypothetical protein [unclassified Campylobacter]